MRGEREESNPCDGIRIRRASQRGRDSSAFFQNPIGRMAKPLDWRAPIEVTMNMRLKEGQIGNLLLVSKNRRADPQAGPQGCRRIDRDHLCTRRRRNLRIRSKKDGFSLASSEPIILKADSPILPRLSLMPAADFKTMERKSPSPASAK